MNYAKYHPKSFIILWELIGQFSQNGYKPVLDTAYQYLSPSLKSSFAGEVLTNKITNMRALAIGAPFPAWSLLDTNLRNVQISFTSKQPKFTLVDFWYSHCGPCIGQFEELKNILKENESYGFAVTGISTDSKNHIQDWKNIIRKYKLPWTQYLDMDNFQASKFTICLFPTNFLLDNNGKILKRDIDMKSLSLFLKENIH
jgi:peroxiredoxin